MYLEGKKKQFPGIQYRTLTFTNSFINISIFLITRAFFFFFFSTDRGEQSSEANWKW